MGRRSVTNVQNSTKTLFSFAVIGIIAGYFLYNYLFGLGIVPSYLFFLFIFSIVGGLVFWFLFKIFSWLFARWNISKKNSLKLATIAFLGSIVFFLYVPSDEIQQRSYLDYVQCKPDGYKGSLLTRYYPLEFWEEENAVLEDKIGRTEFSLLLSFDVAAIEKEFNLLDETLQNIKETRENIKDVKNEVNETVKKAERIGFYKGDKDLIYLGYLRGDFAEEEENDFIDKFLDEQEEKAINELSNFYINNPDFVKKFETIHSYKKKLQELGKASGMLSPHLQNPLNELLALKKCQKKIKNKVKT